MNTWYREGVSEHTSYSEGASEEERQLQGYGDDGPARNNQIFHTLSIEMMTANKLVSLEAMTMSIPLMSHRERSNDIIC
jgi:hypothetical protein